MSSPFLVKHWLISLKIYDQLSGYFLQHLVFFEFKLLTKVFNYIYIQNRHNLNTGGNSTIQLAALIGAYKNALKKADK